MVRLNRTFCVLLSLCATAAFASAPTATTVSATPAGNGTSAALNGSGNPNGESATGWFRLDTTNPGTCDDVFGTRVPNVAGSGLGTGTTSAPYSITANGLLPGTTYYYCAIVSNASGKAFGAVLSFGTPAQLPTITTTSATSVTSSSATLEGTANANGSNTTAYYRYGTSNPGTCNTSFGTRAPTSGGTAVTGNTTGTFTEPITGLSAGVTYYYCAIGTNGVGTSYGNVLQFTTLVAAPTVTTTSVSSITGTTATLSGTGNPNGATTTGWFRIANSDPGGCNDAFGTRWPSSGGANLGSTSGNVGYTQGVTGLSPGTTYYYCAIASNSVGLGFGNVLTFTTPSTPSVTTNAVTSVSATAATFNGSAIPNLAATNGYFRFSTTNPGVCDDVFGTATGSTSLGAGSTSQAYTYTYSSLLPGTTYYYCAVAKNSVGTGFGSLQTFTTPPAAPYVFVDSVANLTGTSATFNGQAEPRGAQTTGYFRYATTNPGTCNDTFGTRLPTSGGSDVGSGNNYIYYQQVANGMTPGATYYYCAIAQNSVGTAFDGPYSFTMPNVPTAVTSTYSVGSGGTSATLYGTVNSNGQGYVSAVGYFRYDTTNPGTCNDTFGTRYPTTGGYTTSTSNITYSYNFTPSTLTPGTTYYFCALGSSTVGVGVGAIQSFTTPAIPTVSTVAQTNLTATSVTLNGSANPNFGSTVGWFRYSTTAPAGGVCADTNTFGTRIPSSGGTSLGSGNTPVAYSQSISLSPGTTYYFCAFASNGVGTGMGSPITFTSPAALPYVSFDGLTNETGTTATLNSTINPRGAATTSWYRYSTTSPGTCNDTFGTRAPASGGTSFVASNTYSSDTQPITGLTPGTTYYFCALAQNSVGLNYDGPYPYTMPNIPTVVTSTSSVSGSGTSVTLYGTVNPNGQNAVNTTAYFRYDTTNPGTCNDTFGTRYPGAGGYSAGSGNGVVNYNQLLAGLTPGTTYYFCAIANNVVGTGFGAVLTFTTPAIPTVVTQAPNPVTATSAQLNGTVTTNNASSTAWFRYWTTNPGSCNDSAVVGSFRVPGSGGTTLSAGTTPTNFSYTTTALNPGTTYWYCAIASNSVGYGYGALQTITTPATAPLISTTSTSSVTANSASLDGYTNPRGDSTTVWWRYSTTNFTCDDTAGTRAPASGGTVIGSDNSYHTSNTPISGLAFATTYYFCEIAQNSVGTTYSPVNTFVTLPEKPYVTTLAATAVTTSSGTMNASAAPNGAAATGWFRLWTSDPGSCSDTGGTRAPASGGTTLGSGTTAVPYSVTPTTLAAGVTYYYCAIASNSAGTSYGQVLTFKTTSTPPSVTTLAASAVTGTTATLNGNANPNGDATTGYFRYATTSPGTCNDTFGTRTPATGGDSLGSGTSGVAYNEPLSGLTPGTTYYFCAISQNSVGTSFGTVLSFATPAAPQVTTNTASPVTATTATLNASAIPGGSTATGWFRYSLTDPGACDDTFGIRTPASGGTNLGSGSASTNFAQALSGLQPGTAYYFCAIAQNAVGYSFGSVLSFVTPAAAPTVTTSAASNIGSTTVTLNGGANPNGANSTGWFRYSTANPGTCSDTFGTRFPATGGSSLGAGTTSAPFSQNVTGLTGNTLYYYCAISSNSIGTSVGSVLTFTTIGAPTTTTSAATLITTTTAQLNGSADPNLDATTAWFRYDTTNPGTCNDTFGTRAPLTGGTAVGSGTAAVSYNAGLTGLSNGTTYYFCAIAQNSVSTTFGAVLSFTTLNAPTVTTVAASSITSTSATISATANPNGATSTGWFRYSTTNPGTCNDTFGTRTPISGGTALGAGSTAVSYTASLTSLASATTYYYCALASNASGTSVGSVMSFTTIATPVVTNLAATSVTSSGATLNANANPRGDATTGFFRYSTTSPGTCNNTFGTRAPLSGGTSLGNGNTTAPYSEVLTGLAPGTTYYYCALATNSVGTTFGSLLSFTTLQGPTVTTSAATLITSTGATLNGSANPRGGSTTGWFRYSTTNPGTCDDVFGTRTSAAGDDALGSGSTAVSYTEAISGLTPATTYYYCAIAQNSVGTNFGTVSSFTTIAAPIVTTNAATTIGSSTATLSGSANARGDTTTAWFRYDTTNPGTCNDTFGTRAPTSSGSLITGSTATAYTQPVSGLTPLTTYYYCAIAQNSVGTSFGTVQTFSTLAGPTATTSAATNVTGTAALLNGSANPNGTSATGWFRYSPVDPGSCNDTFGTRTPSSGGTALGSGSTAVNYSQSIVGLATGSTYYYCAIASNSVGTSFGAVQSFTTIGVPVVTTTAATLVTSTTATFNGTANPRGDNATGWFRYSTVSPGSCNTSFGTRAPVSTSINLGNGTTATPFSQPVTGLSPGTTYYYCAEASNSVATGLGAVQSFTTLTPPTVATSSATSITGSTATLNGAANPNGDASTGWFRYDTNSPGTCNDTFGTRAPSSGGTSLGAGTTAANYSQPITGLLAGTTYYYCALASNSVGTAVGLVQSFTTPGTPTATTVSATAVTGSSATLTGSGNPTGATATGWFRYSTTNPGSCNDTFGTRAPSTSGTNLGAGSSATTFTQTINGLSSSTTYYYCAIVQNVVGTSFGGILSFTTPSAPTVTTLAATGVLAGGATMNGSANPGGDATTAWFRFSAINPGSCNDTFGVRAPTSSGSSLGSGTSPTSFSQTVSGLIPGSTYYYCAIAQNSVGTSFGSILTFTMPANAPTVTSSAASAVSSTGAALNGSGNPGGASATGWFRYATTSPGTCNDTFGTRAPASGGSSLGSGNNPTTYFQNISGLTAGTTYYFCAIASNSQGTAFGQVLSFTTQAAPTVTTSSASGVTPASATFNGTVVANGSTTNAWFRFSTTNPGQCDDSFGTRVPATGATLIGSGTAPVGYSQVANGLLPGTDYFFCAIAQNGVGTSFGQVLTFTSVAPPPLVTTQAPSDITSTSATVNGTANANGTPTTGWFRYDTTNPGSCNDNFGTRVPFDGGLPLGSGTGVNPYSAALTGLKSNTTYYFCAIASNKGGAAFGQVLTLKTDFAPPTVTTLDPSVEPTGVVTLKATANPNGLDATGWFQYDKTNPGQCHENFGTRTRIFPLGNGNEDQQFSETIQSMPAGTYYYCAIAFTTAGTSHGEIKTFDVGGGSDGAGAGGCHCASAPSGSSLALFMMAGLVFFARRRRSAAAFR